jgi:LPS sulfotransferase NodH
MVAMIDAPKSYILCGTPRSGSTLLCEMLYRTGVAGRPNSYFREVDIAYWAGQWGLSLADGTVSADFDRAFIAAMREAGECGTGIFGLRVMFASLADAGRRLGRALGTAGDLPAQLETAFGPLLYIHLSRGDKLGQAVSLVRAEQTGLWHLNADGSVLEGAERGPEPVYDGERIATVLKGIEADDRAWSTFFAVHGIKPLRLTYEGLTAAPQQALADILGRMGLEQAIARSMALPTAKMADATSRDWVERFRRGD